MLCDKYLRENRILKGKDVLENNLFVFPVTKHRAREIKCLIKNHIVNSGWGWPRTQVLLLIDQFLIVMNNCDFLLFFLILNSFLMWTTCTYPSNSTYFPDDLSFNCFSLELLASHCDKRTGSIQDLPWLTWCNCWDQPVLDGSVRLLLPRNASYSKHREEGNLTSQPELPLSWE